MSHYWISNTVEIWSEHHRHINANPALFSYLHNAYMSQYSSITFSFFKFYELFLNSKTCTCFNFYHRHNGDTPWTVQFYLIPFLHTCNCFMMNTCNQYRLFENSWPIVDRDWIVSRHDWPIRNFWDTDPLWLLSYVDCCKLHALSILRDYFFLRIMAFSNDAKQITTLLWPDRHIF
jgi:hypothetical protein